MRMSVRNRLALIGILVALSLSFNLLLPQVMNGASVQSLVNKDVLSDYEDDELAWQSKRSGEMPDVLEEAEKERKMVEAVLVREGGERDLLSLGEKYEFEPSKQINETQKKLKKLQELIGQLEETKKHLAMKSKAKKKNGKRTAQPQSPTNTSLVSHKKKTITNCSHFDEEAKTPRTVIPFILTGSTSVQRSDVTFVTHLSVTRLDMLEKLMAHWSGPLSVALCATPDAATQLTTALHRVRAFSQGRVDLHVVANHGNFYPGNFLRNVALNHTRTEYVFLSDADFIPMYGIHTHLKQAVHGGLLDNSTTKRVLVVPAFEFTKKDWVYPKSKSNLITLWNNKKAFPFHHKLKPAHGPTNFQKWKTAAEPYVIKWREYFEPYIAMKTSQAPRYHEGFVGREFNKISQLMEVKARGFQFMVLPDTFTIHIPHKKRATTRTNYKCAVRLYRIFQKQLRKKYNVRV